MDKKEIQKLTQDELKTNLIAKGVDFKESASKEDLIKLLENQIKKENSSKQASNKKNESKADSKEEVLGIAVIEKDIEERGISLRENTIEEKAIRPPQEKPSEEEEEFELDGLANAGTVLNIIGAVLWLPFLIMASLVIIGIPFLIGNIFTITSNLAYRKGKGSRMKAGILGVIFGFIVGGVLVLVAKDQSVKKEK